MLDFVSLGHLMVGIISSLSSSPTVPQFGHVTVVLDTRFNTNSTKRMKPRWQLDKEALWLIENPTYLPKCVLPFLGICQFY